MGHPIWLINEYIHTGAGRGPWMQPPSGGLRDLVLALAAPANASKAFT